MFRQGEYTLEELVEDNGRHGMKSLIKSAKKERYENKLLNKQYVANFRYD